MTQHFLRTVREWLYRIPLAGCASLALTCALGCSSGAPWKSNQSLFSRTPLFSPSTDGASIDDVQGPLERNLKTASYQQNNANSRQLNSAGFREYEAARELYEQGNYSAAEKAFKKIADEHAVDDSGFFRKRKLKNLFSTRSALEANYYDNPLVEDSLFMLAESRYLQEKLPGAEDIYLQLLKQYPNTRHLDASTKRLFDIALTWMQFKSTTASEVEMASHSDTGRAGAPKVVRNEDYKRPGFFNVTDRTRPITDTEGRALEALKAIWLNDPTGPLADDALMLTASHYLRVGHYMEAAETFKLLREEFPNSPHLKDAYILGAYVTQASYQGAHYDDKNLEQSRQLRQTALNVFQDLTPEERARLQSELEKVDDAVVAREFERALFWLRKGRFDAVEMSCHYVINKYPQSKYAGKARGLIKKLPEYRNQNTLLLALQGITIDDIESIDEPLNGPAANPLDSSPVRPQPAQAVPKTPPQGSSNPAAEPAPADDRPGRPRYLPAMEMPKLKPIPIPRLWPDKAPEADQPPAESADPAADPGRVNLTLGSDG